MGLIINALCHYTIPLSRDAAPTCKPAAGSPKRNARFFMRPQIHGGFVLFHLNLMGRPASALPILLLSQPSWEFDPQILRRLERVSGNHTRSG
jgi:hypothetical protein